MNNQSNTQTSTIITATTKSLRQFALKFRPHFLKAKRACRRGVIRSIRWYRSLQAINQGRLQGAIACSLAIALILAIRPAPSARQQTVAAIPAPAAKNKPVNIVEKQTPAKPKTVATTATPNPKTISNETMQGLFQLVEKNQKSLSQQRAISDSQALAMRHAQLLQQQHAQSLQIQAQQGASEAAHYEMQRYRRQMTGRPGF